MSLWKIAWRSIQRRALASSLTAFSMALGVMLVVGVLLIQGVVEESFRNNASLGYNVILGAKGGSLQLVLNSVFFLSQPVENIPYSFYEDFLPAAQRGDGQNGVWASYVHRVVPICMGDYYKEFRLVGTNSQMFHNAVYDEDTGASFQFAQGRNLKDFSEEYGYFEAVVGARVAREAGLKLGDEIAASHGSIEGDKHGDKFYVVGILAPSGTPNDRAVFVNMEGFYLLEGHAKPVPQKGTGGEGASDVAPAAPPTPVVRPPADDRPAHQVKRTPLPKDQREVTALLVKMHPTLTRGVTNMINEGSVAQAVLPIGEITSLFNRILAPFQRLLLVLTGMICVVSGISILVSIYNSMSDRRREIAIMRSLGADRRTVMAIVLLEAIILALGGGLLGWIGGHALIGVASPWIESSTGVLMHPFQMAPAVDLVGFLTDEVWSFSLSLEWVLIPGLIVLAVIVGFLPALSAYRTDVAAALSANP